MGRVLKYLCVIGSVFLVYCSKPAEEIPIKTEPKETEISRDDTLFVFKEYAPLADKPVKIHYYIPSEGDITKMRILFAMHGADRNALYQIDPNWKHIAEDRGFILLAPEFEKVPYPEASYQYGGVSESRTSWRAVPRERWTYNIIEAVFDYVKEKTGNRSEKYDIWGHSAGGQFVHRFMFYMPQARVATAIASNAGFYTLPLLDGYTDPSSTSTVYSYPYSLKGTDFTKEDVLAYFSKNMVVHLGTNDLATTSEQDSSLPTAAGAKAQGAARYNRGHFFFNKSKECAERYKCEFNWRLLEVEGIGHNSYGMVNRGPNAAFAILYD